MFSPYGQVKLTSNQGQKHHATWRAVQEKKRMMALAGSKLVRARWAAIRL
jgi:hypothetical protein